MNELVILSTECLCFQEASPRGSTFQAMVSVMAVKIQLSSPRGVRLSLSLPGILQRSATQMEECQRRQTVLHVAQVTHSKNSHRADSAQCDWTSLQCRCSWTITMNRHMTADSCLQEVSCGEMQRVSALLWHADQRFFICGCRTHNCGCWWHLLLTFWLRNKGFIIAFLIYFLIYICCHTKYQQHVPAVIKF